MVRPCTGERVLVMGSSALLRSGRSGSDILYLRLPGQPAIVVNSVSMAVDLLEKRSENYSDRATVIMDKLCAVALLGI